MFLIFLCSLIERNLVHCLLRNSWVHCLLYFVQCGSFYTSIVCSKQHICIYSGYQPWRNLNDTSSALPHFLELTSLSKSHCACCVRFCGFRVALLQHQAKTFSGTNKAKEQSKHKSESS